MPLTTRAVDHETQGIRSLEAIRKIDAGIKTFEGDCTNPKVANSRACDDAKLEAPHQDIMYQGEGGFSTSRDAELEAKFSDDQPEVISLMSSGSEK